MENPELERRLTVFQALIRGFLVRRHFSSLRGDYEEIVREIDGDLSHLEWHGNLIPVPGFSYEKGARPRSQDGPAAGPPGAEPGSGSRGNEPGPATEVLQPERDASGTREQQAPEDPAAPAPPVETCRAVGQHSEARAGPQADSTGRLAGWEDGRQSGSRTDATATRDSVALDAGSGVLRAVSGPEAETGNAVTVNNEGHSLIYGQTDYSDRIQELQCCGKLWHQTVQIWGDVPSMWLLFPQKERSWFSKPVRCSRALGSIVSGFSDHLVRY
ncbi:IQ domain-containing protein C isoform X1 [Lepisosteus oculatus]|uniref:IQ domain-containing protein C isoform X1 n=1 Tax=Lepisosteus oculatus TaxID=7918 RepID=UPI0035F52CCF